MDVEIKASQTESRQWSGGGCREQTRPDTVLSHHDRSVVNSFSIQIIIYNILDLTNIQYCSEH